MQDMIFDLSFRCYYDNGNTTNHFQSLRLADIPRWIDSYKFTHPGCISITVKLWFSDLEKDDTQKNATVVRKGHS